MTITVSTDGSALGNPNGPMGWAWADHEQNAGGKPGHKHDDHGYDAGRRDQRHQPDWRTVRSVGSFASASGP